MSVSLLVCALLAVPALSQEWWENSWGNNNNNNNWNQRTRYQCWSGGRWVPEGTENERGRFWYRCEQGTEKPAGCLDENRRRLRIGESYVAQGGYEMTCVLGRDNYLSFEMTGCYDEESRRSYKEGESWDSYGRKFWYTCNRITDWHLRKDIGGCLDNGQRVQLDQIVDNYQTETFWQCDRKTDGSVAMCIKGCRHNNQRYKIGEQWPDGTKVYTCRLENGRCQKVLLRDTATYAVNP